MPTAPSTLSGLLIQQDQSSIYAGFLSLAATVGLPVTSWQPGDPTRSTFFVEAAEIADLETVAVGFIQGGYLDYAALPINDSEGNPLPASTNWLTVLAKQTFNVDVPAATYAPTSVTLTNSSGYVYTVGPGDLTFSNSSTGATYHNTSGGTIHALGTLSVTVLADQAGSAGSAGAGEIDTLQTTLLGVTCTNPTAAVGLDEQAAETTIAQCRDKLGSLSPNGPPDAYAYVARNQALTGVSSIANVKVYDDSDTGDVLVYVAGVAGSSVGGPDVAAVQAAIQKWATPLCITPTVSSASPVAINITYSIWIYASVNQTTTQVQNAIQIALEGFFANRPIGGDVIPPATSGVLYASMIEAVIGTTFPGKAFRVVVNLPAGDTPFANNQVAALGTVTPAVFLIQDP